MPSSGPEEASRWIHDELREHERERRQAPGPDPVPELLRYEIRERIGEGSTAAVFRAWDVELNRPVALKLLHESASRSEVARQRFRREAQAAGALSHPNLVGVFDVGEEKGRPYLVMELVEGRPLSRLLEGPRGEPRETVALLEKAARGVAAAHEKGVVHRDLKPANILVTASGEPKVGDFGLAHLVDSAADLTRTGAVLGTPLYMAPEQVGGRSKEISPRTDVYALGAILYEGVTGRVPHSAESLADLYSHIVGREPDPPRKVNPKLSRELETIVLKALDKDPGRRYAHAGEFADDLLRFLKGEAIAARPEGVASKLGRRLSRHPVAYALAVATVAAVVAAGGGWAKFREERELAVRTMRDSARLSVETALELRRRGGNLEMRRLLPPLEEAFRGAVGRAPDLAEMDYLMGRMYRALMDDAKALACQERALGKDPAFPPALYERAVLRSKEYGRELRRALEIDRALGAGGPDEAERSRPGLARLRERILEDCRELDRLLRAGGPAGVTGASLLAARGILAYHRGNYAEARADLDRAVREDPRLEEAWETLARSAQARAGQAGGAEEKLRLWREAEALYAGGASHDRGYLPHYLGLSDTRLERGLYRTMRGEDPVADYSAAEGDLSQALQLEAGSSEARVRRGMVRALRGSARATLDEALPDYAAAEEDLTEALRRGGESGEAQLRRGMVRTLRGIRRMGRAQDPMPDYSAAEEDFAEARRTESASPDLWIWWGYLRIHKGVHWMRLERDPMPEYARAEGDFTEALRLNRDHLLAWRYRAYLWAQRAFYRELRREDSSGDYAKAEQDLTEALRVNAESLNSWKLRGDVRTKRGLQRVKRGEDPLPDFGGAEADFTRAIELLGTDGSSWARRGSVRLERARAREKSGDAAGAKKDYAAAARDFQTAMDKGADSVTDLDDRLGEALKKASDR